MVYIVGAGPGDPLLITVRGLACLRAADVVLYDHRVSPRLLQEARADAEKIDVGDSAARRLDQQAICYLLADKGREHGVVTRLTSGDPLIFDQGGPEALFLHERGIPFEVVPGIPAAIGAAAYAGIPLTYPGGGRALTFVQDDDGRGASHAGDATAIADLDGTVVTHATAAHLRSFLRTLVARGRPASETGALVFDGTLATQQTTVARLDELIAALDHEDAHRPALLIVGRVAALRPHLRWFDVRPLFGKRVLVTRPRHQSAELIERLQAHGADVVEAPMIRIAPPDDYGPLDGACARINEFDWIVFSSANAVEPLVQRLLHSSQDLRALHRAKLCAVGTSTAERLAAFGLKVDLVPSEHRAEGVAQALLTSGDVTGRQVLLPRSDIGREVIADELRKHGAAVTEVVAYRNVPADPDRDGSLDLYGMLLNRAIDVVTFTSASAVRNFVTVLGGAEPAADLLRSTIVASIGPVTAEAAAQYSITTTIVPHVYTVPALVDAIAHHFAPAGARAGSRDAGGGAFHPDNRS